MTPDDIKDTQALRTIKFETPLSVDVDCYLIFNGPPPDRACFNRLHAFIDLIQDAIVTDAPTHLKPCEKHPRSLRNPSSNRCIDCLKEIAERMNAAKRKKAAGKPA